MSIRRRVDFFYDVISPYSWIAFEFLCRYREKWNLELAYRPFYLAGIMGNSGNSTLTVPNKVAYAHTDLIRQAKIHKIHVKTPEHPMKAMSDGSLSAQRFLVSLGLRQPSLVEAASRECWKRRWQADKSIVRVDDMKEICKAIGFTGALMEDTIAHVEDPLVKQMLKKNTEEALELNCFGSPWIVVEDGGRKHSFFGSDRFESIALIFAPTFSLWKVGEEFRAAAAGSSDDVIIQHYLSGFAEVDLMLNALGRLFHFISQELEEKASILKKHLERDPDHYKTVIRMTSFESESGFLNSNAHIPGGLLNGSRTFLRLHRALAFIIKFISDTIDSPHSSKSSTTAAHAYDATLAKFHPWVLRKGVHLAVYTLPYRKDLVTLLLHGEAETESLKNDIHTKVVQPMRTTYQRVEDLYTKLNLHDLP